MVGKLRIMTRRLELMSEEVSYIQIHQPIGSMYLVKLPAKLVAKISATDTRKAYNDNQIKGYAGVQRKLEPNRVKSIAEYCNKSDAMFPTPIILSAPSNKFEINTDMQTIKVPCDNVYCSIIDGQHRIEGIKESGLIDKFDLFVEFVFDTDPSRDAYLFSVVNGNQKPVSKSLIYDLFGVSKARTVEKMCNKIMRELNTNTKSKMAGRIKMLGFKDEFSPKGVVSQARLIDEIIKLITDDKDKDNYDIEVGNYMRKLDPERYIFRNCFINNDHESIVNENIRFFNCWLDMVERHKNNSTLTVLEKSLGFSTAYRLLLPLYNLNWDYEAFLSDLIEAFFYLELDKQTFSSSESGIVDLLYTLIGIGMKKEIFSEEFIKIFYNEKQIEKIKAKRDMFIIENKWDFEL